jgi:hypothetical protein
MEAALVKLLEEMGATIVDVTPSPRARTRRRSRTTPPDKLAVSSSLLVASEPDQAQYAAEPLTSPTPRRRTARQCKIEQEGPPMATLFLTCQQCGHMQTTVGDRHPGDRYVVDHHGKSIDFCSLPCLVAWGSVEISETQETNHPVSPSSLPSSSPSPSVTPLRVSRRRQRKKAS